MNDIEDADGDGVCDADETCNGAVVDLLTGLAWLQDGGCLGVTGDWRAAVEAAHSLHAGDDSGCGLSDESLPGDWRLPNVREIGRLFDYDRTLDLMPSAHPFINVIMLDSTNGVSPGHFLTSTPSDDSGDGAYVVSACTGWVQRFGTSYSDPQGVWAVRHSR